MSIGTMMKTGDFPNGGSGGVFNEPDYNEPTDAKQRRAKTGLRALLCVISSMFFLFIIAFVIRSQLSDWEHLSGPWKPLADPWQLWVNTGFLLLASIFFQWSRMSSKQGNIRNTAQGLVLGGVFTIAFIGGQLMVWREMEALGYYVAVNPANSFFYLLTGLHGLHLLGGLVAWLRTSYKMWRGAAVQSIAASVELCAIYWHYLLGLWFVLLGLLTSSPETYAAFARLCGF